MSDASDRELLEAIARVPDDGWRQFIDQYTPTLLAFIQRAGVRDRDEAMEVYVRACEQLSADRCARLRRYDRSKGNFRAWLAVVMRHLVTDWIRSRRGRRRLFAAVKDMDEVHQRVFQLYYWDGRRLSEIAEQLRVEKKARSLEEVLSIIQDIDDALSDRHRSELVSYAARARPWLSLDSNDDGELETQHSNLDAEQSLHRVELETILSETLSMLPPEEAAILRLKYEGHLSIPEIRRALHLPDLSSSRVRTILKKLRDQLEARGLTSSETRSVKLEFPKEDPE